MNISDLTDPNAVESAIAEYDKQNTKSTFCKSRKTHHFSSLASLATLKCTFAIGKHYNTSIRVVIGILALI